MNLLATRFDQHPTEHQRYRNTMIGLAAGDAWGLPVEFTHHNRMPSYPVTAPTGTWRISDDTQMALAVNDALTDLTVEQLDDLTVVDEALIARFLDWYADPDNTRAPGMTCMGSLAAIKSGKRWFHRHGARVSRGCGAVMRVAPAAFADDAHWAGLAALQAVITHNHPASALSALLVADAIRHSREHSGRYITNALITINAIDDGTHPWCTDPFLARALEPVLRRGGKGKTPMRVQDYLLEGLHAQGRHSHSGSSLLDALLAASEVQHSYHQLTSSVLLTIDPCRRVGEGWDSPTAAALSLLVADMATSGPLTPSTALAWAATSNGDSDSIAAIGGAILGAVSDQPDFWAQEGIEPTFEPRYDRAITNLPEPSMELGVYPPDASPRLVSSYAATGPAAESAKAFGGFTDDPLDYEAVHDGFSEDEVSAFDDMLDEFPDLTLDEDDPACIAASDDYADAGLPDSDLWLQQLRQMNG